MATSLPNLRAKSCQVGFFFLIRAVFFSRRHFVISVSRTIAFSTVLENFVIMQAINVVPAREISTFNRLVL
jgi:hypothetical protein